MQDANTALQLFGMDDIWHNAHEERWICNWSEDILAFIDLY